VMTMSNQRILSASHHRPPHSSVHI
jgi:hypothetical protein